MNPWIKVMALAIASVVLSSVSLISIADDKPLNQRGHDERIKREQETKERVARENALQRKQDEIRDKARKGGYEAEYDRALRNNAGPRTTESTEKSRPKRGTGHQGDHSQPGLTGTEGAR